MIRAMSHRAAFNTAVGLLIAAAMSACSGTAELGNTDLGIARFVVTEDAGRALRVQGVDAAGQQIAGLTLRLGEVPVIDEAATVDGRQLVIEFGDKHAEHVSAGYERRQLPLLSDAQVQAFVLDPHVAGPLARWGITFGTAPAPNEPAGERGYSGCIRSGCIGGTTESCCQWASGNTTFEYRCCGGLDTLSQRDCPGVPTCPAGGTYNPPSQLCNGVPSCPAGAQLCSNNTRCCSIACGAVLGPGGCGVYWSESYAGRNCNTTDSGSSCAYNWMLSGWWETDLSGSSGGLSPTGTDTVSLFWQEGITFFLSGSDYSIAPFGPYAGGESVSGNELHSTYNGQWGVTITHTPTGTTQTINYLRAN